MGDSVKYQIEKAQSALRSALELGAMYEDVWTLSQIVSGLSSVEGLLATPEQKNYSLTNPYYRGYIQTGLDDIISVDK
jgi:hypothetical protein